MNALVFAAGSLLALFWAVVSVIANVFSKQVAPPKAVRPPPSRQRGRLTPSTSQPATPQSASRPLPETASETISLYESIAPSTSTTSEEREPLTVDLSPPVVKPSSLLRSNSTAATSATGSSSSSSSTRPRRTFSEFKVAFSNTFSKRRSTGSSSNSGSVTDTELASSSSSAATQHRRERSRSSSRTRAQLVSIFTGGLSRSRTTPSPASSDFPLTPSDSPFPLPLERSGTMTSRKSADIPMRAPPSHRASVDLPSATPRQPPVRRVSMPIPANPSTSVPESSTAPVLGVHFALPPLEPKPAVPEPSSSLGLEIQPAPAASPSTPDLPETPRGRRPFWTRSFAKRTSTDMNSQQRYDKENVSGTESESQSSRFRRGRRSLSLVRTAPATQLLPALQVSTPVSPVISEASPDKTIAPAAALNAQSPRKSWLDRRDSLRTRSAERAPLKDRHTRCAEVAHAVWGPTAQKGNKVKRPRTPRSSVTAAVPAPAPAPSTVSASSS